MKPSQCSVSVVSPDAMACPRPTVAEGRRPVATAAPACIAWARRARGLRRGFTLIELLVVIAIVALMIAILLPALKTARETAIASTCLSNMRQLGVAQFNYAATYEGRFAPAALFHHPKKPTVYNYSWADRLALTDMYIPKLGSNGWVTHFPTHRAGIGKCPNGNVSASPRAAGYSISGLAQGYRQTNSPSGNGAISMLKDGPSGDPNAAFSPATNNHPFWYYAQIDRLRSGSVFLMEGGAGTNDNAAAVVEPPVIRTGTWDLFPTVMPAGTTNPVNTYDTVTGNNSTTRISAILRHLDASNYMFGDMSARTLPPSALGSGTTIGSIWDHGHYGPPPR